MVTSNLIKPFFSASLQQPRHNTANARDLAAHPCAIFWWTSRRPHKHAFFQRRSTAAIPKSCRPFLLPPDTERRPPRLPHHKSQTLNRPEPQLASIVRKAPSIPRQGVPQPSPSILTPHQQRSPDAPLFPPNATRAIEQDGLGGSPYLVSKIIPQREGPRCQRFVEARQRGPSCARTFWKLSTGTRPSRPVGSEYPCCYSALPTELRLVMRILTSSVISRMPSLAGFLGSKQAGFSAM